MRGRNTMKSTDRNKTSVSISPRAERKPYEKPVLINYGDIGSMTKTAGATGGDDGGVDPTNKSMV